MRQFLTAPVFGQDEPPAIIDATALIGSATEPAPAASPFDPEVATRAYLDTFGGGEKARSDAYFEGGYWLQLWGLV